MEYQYHGNFKPIGDRDTVSRLVRIDWNEAVRLFAESDEKVMRRFYPVSGRTGAYAAVKKALAVTGLEDEIEVYGYSGWIQLVKAGSELPECKCTSDGSIFRLGREFLEERGFGFEDDPPRRRRRVEWHHLFDDFLASGDAEMEVPDGIRPHNAIIAVYNYRKRHPECELRAELVDGKARIFREGGGAHE